MALELCELGLREGVCPAVEHFVEFVHACIVPTVAQPARAWLDVSSSPCTVQQVRSIPNQPSNELGAQLTVCHTESCVQDGVVRLTHITFVLVNGYGDVAGEWSHSFVPSSSTTIPDSPADGHVFAELADFMRGLIQNRVFVSHHVEAELRLLDREFTIAGMSMPQVRAIDTMDIAQEILPALPSYALDSLANRFGISANSGAERIWQLLCHLQALDPLDLTHDLEIVAAPSPPEVLHTTLEGLTVCVSGFLPHLSQEKLLAQVEAHGGAAVSSPNPETDIVVLGLGYNPALAAFAISLNRPLLGIEWFDLLCQDPPAAQLRAGSGIPRSMAATEPGALNIALERQQWTS